jgi:quercetin 2,3-dioxygenase
MTMNRKQFLKNSLAGLAGVAATGTLKAEAGNSPKPDEEIVGFNHIPPTKDERTMKSVLHKASTRGHANHGWLNSFHTFSFAQYYNPERVRFGVLRVLNDDTIEPGKGFGTHPHDNMEIISIPLEGDLEHKDSMGNTQVIHKGDIQVMSAGTGIRHSEYNRNTDKEVKFLQIWLFPRERGVTPRYDQMPLDPSRMKNTFLQILSPNPDDEGVWIHQDAWFHIGRLSKGTTLNYAIKRPGNGLYTFVLEGEVTVAGEALNKRDGFGIWDTDQVSYRADSDTEVLLMEVPM